MYFQSQTKKIDVQIPWNIKLKYLHCVFFVPNRRICGLADESLNDKFVVMRLHAKATNLSFGIIFIRYHHALTLNLTEWQQMSMFILVLIFCNVVNHFLSQKNILGQLMFKNFKCSTGANFSAFFGYFLISQKVTLAVNILDRPLHERKKEIVQNGK